MFPFPNNFWLRQPTSGGPARLNISDDTFPKTALNESIHADKGGWNTLDGFSPMAAMYT
jgi:hypothetical protein